MQTYKDKTFCASPDCQNDCGRKMSPFEEMESKEIEANVSYAYFCGVPRCDETKDMFNPTKEEIK